MKKLGLALGGGGIAGCAHIGVLAALEEAGIQVHSLAGSSAGAIVAALYAYGQTTDQLTEMVRKVNEHYLDYDYQSLVRLLFRRKVQGFVKGEKLHALISKSTNNARLKDVKFPLALLATDLRKARTVIFSSHPMESPSDDQEVITDSFLADAVQASFSIPVLFNPVKMGSRILVDGGLLDNCPVTAARHLGADKVLGVNLVFAEPVHESFNTLSSILNRVINIGLSSQSRQITKNADLVLHPEVGSIGILDFAQLEKSLEIGYEHTRKRIDEIKEVLTEGKYDSVPARTSIHYRL